MGIGTGVAIVGMGCRLAGGVNSPEQYWDFMLRHGDWTVEAPAERWNADLFYDADPDAPGRAYTRHGGFVTMSPWDFDAEFGAINPDLMPTITIYLGEFGAQTGYHQPDWVDANWIKDSFYKTFRTEYKRKLFILNNTLLNPTNISNECHGVDSCSCPGSINRPAPRGHTRKPTGAV